MRERVRARPSDRCCARRHLAAFFPLYPVSVGTGGSGRQAARPQPAQVLAIAAKNKTPRSSAAVPRSNQPQPLPFPVRLTSRRVFGPKAMSGPHQFGLQRGPKRSLAQLGVRITEIMVVLRAVKLKKLRRDAGCADRPSEAVATDGAGTMNEDTEVVSYRLRRFTY